MQRVPPAATALLATALVVAAAVGVGVPATTVAAGDAQADDDPTATVVARYPSDGEMVEEPVVTPDSVANASAPQQGRAGGWYTQIQLTDDGAAAFAETLVDSGFTSDGVQACPDTDERNDEGYCLLTVVDGEVTTAASLSAQLAESIESGEFEPEAGFVFKVANETAAERAARAFGWTPENETTSNATTVTTTDGQSATADASTQTTTPAVSATETTEPGSGDSTSGTAPGLGVVAALAGVAGGALAVARTD